MSDNRRRYRTIKCAIKELYPTEPTGNEARHLHTLTAMIRGIFYGPSEKTRVSSTCGFGICGPVEHPCQNPSIDYNSDRGARGRLRY